MLYDLLMNSTFLQIVGLLICGYYLVKILIYKDTSVLNPKGVSKPKNPEMYTKWSVGLLWAIEISIALNMVLLRVNEMLGHIQLLICIVVLMAIWIMVSRKYGGTR